MYNLNRRSSIERLHMDTRPGHIRPGLFRGTSNSRHLFATRARRSLIPRAKRYVRGSPVPRKAPGFFFSAVEGRQSVRAF